MISTTEQTETAAFQPKVAIDYLAIRFGKDRHSESELADAGPDPVDGFLVLARVALVGLETLDGPVFDTESLAGRGTRQALDGIATVRTHRLRPIESVEMEERAI